MSRLFFMTPSIGCNRDAHQIVAMPPKEYRYIN